MANYSIPKYCVSLSDRIIGDATPNPTGFIVYNISHNNCFVVSGGMWAYQSIIPQPIVVVWNLSSNLPANATLVYFVDPVNGNDSNNGLSPLTAWKTTTAYADTIPLIGNQAVGYKYNGSWVLYRRLGMTMDEIVLPLNLVTFEFSNI